MGRHTSQEPERNGSIQSLSASHQTETDKSVLLRGSTLSRSPSNKKARHGCLHRTVSSDDAWKPLSLTTPILAALLVLTLLIATTIEVLAQRSQTYGGLAISPSLDQIPDFAMWSYLYGPNLVAVLYSMIWTWVDLDARRMQPWFELSKPEGATAENSLLLEYSFDFIAVVPWKSGKRRHWPVFLASTALMVVFWAITPLQSAILATGMVNRPMPINLVNTSQLLAVTEQPEKLNSILRGEIYYTTWLNLERPPFTTPDFALLPFYVDEFSQLPENEGNITAITTKLWTELTCSPANTQVGDNISPNGVLWDNSIPIYVTGGNGCNATVWPDLLFWHDDPEFSMSYWGSYRDEDENKTDMDDIGGISQWELSSSECPDVRNQFVAGWMHQQQDESSALALSINISATWCQVGYYKQRVRASVDVKTMRPLPGGIQEMGQRERLSDEEFNTTAFEKFIRAGQLDRGLVNAPEQFMFQHEPFLYNHTLQAIVRYSRQIQDPVGYALAIDMHDLEEYSKPEVMAHAYDLAWKQQFAIAASHLITNASMNINQQGVVRGSMAVIIVSRPFAIAVEALLLVVATINLALLCACRKATCHLQANPSSTKRLGDVTGNSPDVIDLFTTMDTMNDNELLEKLRGARFRLRPGASDRGTEPTMEIVQQALQTIQSPGEKVSKHFQSTKPFALHRGVGLAFLVSVCGAVTGLGYLKAQELAGNGLKRPSENFEVLQLLENYIPTVLATLTEPFWLLLNRLLCLLQPFKDLCTGKAKPKRSIEATYTAIPPQLVIWRALAARHLVLAVVCMTALLANLLALSMGALFNEELADVLLPQKFQTVLAERFDKSLPDLMREEGQEGLAEQRQPYSVAVQGNVTRGLALPPWTTEDYYFHPIELFNLKKNDTVTVLLRGYTIDTDCDFYAPTKVSLGDVDETLTGVDQEEILCDPPAAEVAEATMRRDMGNDRNPEGESKYEYAGFWPLSVLIDEPGAKVHCDPSFSLGWGKTSQAQNNKSDIMISRVLCQPKFKTAMFNVTVNKAGRVLRYHQTSKLETQLRDSVSQDHVRMLIAVLQADLISSQNEWSNDTRPMLGFNWLLSSLLGSDALTNPNEDLPANKEDVVPQVERLMRLYFVSFLSFNTAVFAQAEPGDFKEGAVHLKEVRIFMNQPAFIVSQVVLAIYILATILFYAQTNKLVLPRMPTTIGSIIAYIAPSRLVTDGDGGGNELVEATYSFGRYVGHDGKTHVGVERDPHVVPIDPESLGETRSLVRRLGWRKKGSETGQPWL